MLGGYAGGQAEYVRVPYADVGPIKVPDGLPDEKVLFLSDIFPTGWHGRRELRRSSPATRWRCGAAGRSGLFAIQSLKLLGAERVIAIDRYEKRLALAEQAGAETLNYADEDSVLGPNCATAPPGAGRMRCIDAVGMEAHGFGIAARYDQIKMGLRLATDRPTALREAIQACRKCGTVSIPGVYGGFARQAQLRRGLRQGPHLQDGPDARAAIPAHAQQYVVDGKIDPSFLITHRAPLSKAPEMYKTFRDERESCVKVVLDPTA